MSEVSGLNKIICGNALDEMRDLPSESFGAVITSPPYNLRAGKNSKVKRSGKDSRRIWQNDFLEKGYDGYSDDMPEREYADWQHQCLHEMLRLIPDEGAVFYNHKWRIQDGLLNARQDMMYAFPVRQIIIWDKCGQFNYNDGYFPQRYEVIYMIAKPGFKMNENARQLGDVWKIQAEQGNPHPCSFPVALPARIIGCLHQGPVLDPFMGSGTTAVAAERAGVDWLGIEQSQKYIDMADKRIEAERAQLRLDI